MFQGLAFHINYSIIFSLQVYCSQTNNKFLPLYFLDMYATLYCNVDSTRGMWSDWSKTHVLSEYKTSKKHFFIVFVTLPLYHKANEEA